VTTVQRHLPASATEVFEVLVDPETYPKWLLGAQAIRNVTEGWPAVGSAFDHRVGWGPLQIPDRTTVRRIVRPCLLELQVRVRPLIEAVATFELADDGDGCLVTISEEPCGPFKLGSVLFDPLIRLRNRRSLQRLAELVEQASQPVAATS
jgi:uncharacterized protein YndB with AHSA1/START domain